MGYCGEVIIENMEKNSVSTPSKKDSLTREDLIKWSKNVLVFSIPALLAFLIALQGKDITHTQLTIAGGMALQAVIASLIDLLKKYSAGN